MHEWRPIDEAPKDGRAFLGFMLIGDQRVTRVLSWDGEDQVWTCSGTGHEYLPTHWMPLPDPPSDSR